MKRDRGEGQLSYATGEIKSQVRAESKPHTQHSSRQSETHTERGREAEGEWEGREGWQSDCLVSFAVLAGSKLPVRPHVCASVYKCL